MAVVPEREPHYNTRRTYTPNPARARRRRAADHMGAIYINIVPLRPDSAISPAARWKYQSLRIEPRWERATPISIAAMRFSFQLGLLGKYCTWRSAVAITALRGLGCVHHTL